MIHLTLRRTMLALLILLSAWQVPRLAADPVTIQYTLSNVGELAGDVNRFRFDYTVTNNLAAPLTDFLIYFDFGPGPDPQMRSLRVESDVADWDEIAIQPSAPMLDGYFEALATGSGLAIGGRLGGFACSFDWIGVGTPFGPQSFEIYDVDFNMIAAGRTTPIPAPSSVSLCMMGLTALLVRRRR